MENPFNPLAAATVDQYKAEMDGIATAAAEKATEKGITLGIEVDGKIYVDSSVLAGVISTFALKEAMGIPTDSVSVMQSVLNLLESSKKQLSQKV